MSELLQSAQHPDADQLTAFAEHALPAHEREQTLAHLATCGACRQLVFLAQAEEPVEAAQPVAMKPVAVRTAWFAGWHLLWPAVALAGIVVFSVHLRHVATGGSEAQKVAIVTEALPIPAAPPLAPAVTLQAIVPAPKPMPRAVMKAPVAIAPAVDAPVMAMNGGAQQQGVAVQAQDQSSPGFLRDRDQSPSMRLHGSMIDQQQTVGAAGSPALAQKYAQARVSQVQAPPAPKLAAGMGMAGAAPAPQPAAPPVAVTLGETVRAAAAAAPAPAAPRTAAQGASQTVEVSSISDMTVTNGMALDATAATGAVSAELPGGRATVSKVSNGSRTVALDATGGVFVSRDEGRHWTAVKAQWPGRAVQVSLNAPVAPEAKARSVEVAKPEAFTLTTDAGATWTSKDGQKWKRK